MDGATISLKAYTHTHTQLETKGSSNLKYLENSFVLKNLTMLHNSKTAYGKITKSNHKLKENIYNIRHTKGQSP